MIEKIATRALRGALERSAMVATNLITYTSRRLDGDDDYEPDAYDIAYTFLVIITILVVVTIFFETIKDIMLDASDKYTR